MTSRTSDSNSVTDIGRRRASPRTTGPVDAVCRRDRGRRDHRLAGPRHRFNAIHAHATGRSGGSALSEPRLQEEDGLLVRRERAARRRSRSGTGRPCRRARARRRSPSAAPLSTRSTATVADRLDPAVGSSIARTSVTWPRTISAASVTTSRKLRRDDGRVVAPTVAAIDTRDGRDDSRHGTVQGVRSAFHRSASGPGLGVAASGDLAPTRRSRKTICAAAARQTRRGRRVCARTSARSRAHRVGARGVGQQRDGLARDARRA